jgi:hypothetical protein
MLHWTCAHALELMATLGHLSPFLDDVLCMDMSLGPLEDVAEATYMFDGHLSTYYRGH